MTHGHSKLKEIQVSRVCVEERDHKHLILWGWWRVYKKIIQVLIMSTDTSFTANSINQLVVEKIGKHWTILVAVRLVHS